MKKWNYLNEIKFMFKEMLMLWVCVVTFLVLFVPPVIIVMFIFKEINELIS